MKQRIVLGIAVLALVAVAGFAGTQAFFSDTEVSGGNVFAAGSIDLTVDHNRATYNGEECSNGECLTNTDTNLIANGSFEENPVTEEEGWEIFEDGVVNAWSVEWADASANSYGGQSRPEASLVEHHGGVNGWNASEGDQYAELDSDWFGPNDPLDGEPALVRISQDVSTTNGETYELRFMFAPRPATGVNQNELKVFVDGTEIAPSSYTSDGTGDSDPQWTQYTYQFTADGANTEIAFEGAGDNDSEGVLLDDVRVHPVECGTEEALWHCELWEAKDLENERFFDFGDIKPGDRGSNLISLHVDDNDSYMCLATENKENNENGLTEPESEVDTGSDGEGELGDNLMFFAWHDEDGDGEYDSVETPLVGSPQTANELDQIAFAENGNALVGGTTDYLGIEWCAGEMTVSGNTISCDGSNMGNESQTDSFLADLQFHAVQARNNDGFTCDQYFGGGEGENETLCSDEVDVMLVLDRSGSMSGDLGTMKTDAKNFVNTLMNSSSGAHVGVVGFGGSVNLRTGLTDDLSAVETAIDNVNGGGGTDMTGGIDTAQAELDGSRSAPDFMIVLTDGSPDSDSSAGNAADNARSAGTTIYAIGVGSGADEIFLESNIADSPSEYFSASNFSELETQFDELLTCEQPAGDTLDQN
ncbi:MAG: TasA family protein [Candidatus Campbellbacteria bacterium]|nr:TasA family protein [Candidatus Campbellbacteria bacterium]